MEHDGIEFAGFHEEVDDINEKLKHLFDSYNRLKKNFLETIKNKKFRSEIDSEVRFMIDVANDVKLIIESMFLPPSTSIPCLTDLRRKLVCLVYISNSIRRGAMLGYERRVVQRLKSFWREVTTSCENAEKKNLSIEMFLSMSIEFVVYEEDLELIATMQKVVKERHEEMIKIDKRMIEFEQVLFQIYVMVQEKLLVILVINEQGNGGDNDQKKKCDEKKMMKIYDSVENLVGTIEEAYHKRERAKHDRTSRRTSRILFMGL